MGSKRVSITVNDATHEEEVEPRTLLVYFLRERLGLIGTKVGCDTSSCGACTVLMDGQAVRSCSVPTGKASGRRITTLEGLGSTDKPHPIQKAFIEEQAAQCGYCINGMIMTSKALLERSPNPSDREIRKALAENLCRCGTHQRIVAAVKRAAVLMAKGG